MGYVTNTTDGDIVQMFDGKNYHFPAGKSIRFDDDNVAKWFASKQYLPPSPAAGRPNAIHRLAFSETLPAGQAPEASHKLIPDAPVEKAVNLLSQPPGHASMPEPPDDIKAKRRRDALNACSKEQLIELAKRHGAWAKKTMMDKPALVEKLASLGVEVRR